MTNTARMLVALGAMLAGAVAACGSDSNTPGDTTTGGGPGGSGGAAAGQCSADPIACPAGQTCWFNDMNGSDLQCFPSGPGKDGDPCDNFVGNPSCGDDMICLQLVGAANGSCTPYCDASHPCPMGVKCIGVQTPGMVLLHACEPKSGGTGGMGGGGGAPSTGGMGGAMPDAGSDGG